MASSSPGPADSSGRSGEPTAAVLADGVRMSPRARVAYRTIRAGLLAVSKAWLRVEVFDGDKVPANGGFILAPGGHRSILDTPMASLATSRVLRYMGAENYFEMPVLGAFLRSAGGFPVERSSTDRAALRVAEAVLANGEPLVVFPEGTRQSGPLIQPLKQGAAFLACRAGVPIVPVGIGGAERAMPKGRNYARPLKIILLVGDPLYPPVREPGERVKRSAISGMSDALSDQLQELYDKAQIQAGV